MIDWRKIFADAAVFHASGIAGAVSKESADATFEALDIADEMGLTLSFDINYRKNLWKYGAEPKATLSKMLSYADVVFADVIEYEYMTDRKVPFPAMSSDYEMPMEVYEEWFDEIHARWPRCQKWLMGMRNMISSSRNTLTALLWDNGKLYSTKIYDIQGIVDSMGVGDAFTAGQLHAINAFGDDSQKILKFAPSNGKLVNPVKRITPWVPAQGLLFIGGGLFFFPIVNPPYLKFIFYITYGIYDALIIQFRIDLLRYLR